MGMDGTPLQDLPGPGEGANAGSAGDIRALANLISFLQDNWGHLMGYRAVRVRLSRLRKRTPDVLLPARRRLAELAATSEVRVFSLPDSDMLAIYHQTATPPVLAVLEDLRELFKRDPVTRQPVTDGKDTDFLGWHVLANEAETLMGWAERAYADALNAGGTLPGSGSRLSAPSLRGGPMPSRGRPLTPEGLAKLEAGLAMADLTTQVRRQCMCAVDPHSRPAPEITELFVNIGELRKTIAPQVDLASNPWLFRRFTATLDNRMLAYVDNFLAAIDTPYVSINLNVQSVLSPAFGLVRDAIKATKDKTLVLELRLDDIMADLPAYLFAREHLHQLGFKVLIDGLGPQAMLWVDRERLGADYLKAMWSPELERLLASDQAPTFSDRVAAMDSTKVILSRCDDARAVEIGRAMGIRLFQGFYLDDLMRDGGVHQPDQPADNVPA